MLKAKTLHDEDVLNAWIEPKPPTIADIVDCLLLDASSVRYALDIDDYAEEMFSGSDAKPSEVIASYEASQRARAWIDATFTREEMAQLDDGEVERL